MAARAAGAWVGMLMLLGGLVFCSSVHTVAGSSHRPQKLGGHAGFGVQGLLRLRGGRGEQPEVPAAEPEAHPKENESPLKEGSVPGDGEDAKSWRKKHSVSGKRRGKSASAGKQGDQDGSEPPSPKRPRGKEEAKQQATAKKGQKKFAKRLKVLVEKLSKTNHHTQEEPGEWEGKEATHVPHATAVEGGVKITVDHVMNEETEEQALHYIEFIWIIDKETGEHLDIVQLAPTDEDASCVFKGKFVGKEVVPYAMCNLHGIWRGSALAVGQ